MIVSIGKMPVFDAIVVSCQCNDIMNMNTNGRVHVATLQVCGLGLMFFLHIQWYHHYAEL